MLAMALRCTTRKELCARFRAVNPATHCDVDRMHKWMQGRAFPRSAQVFDDVATVIGSSRSGGWIAACRLEEFAEELMAMTGVEPEALRASAPARRPQATSLNPAILGGARALIGDFACYSQSWSPHYEGRLVRSALTIEPGRGHGLRMAYTERLAGQMVTMRGDLFPSGRAIHAVVHEPESNLPLFFMLHLPGPPASVLSGIMAGSAFLSHDSLPSACRFVAVRAHDRSALDGSNRYIDRSAAEIAHDLSVLGVDRDLARSAGPLLERFLSNCTEQVPLAEQRQLADAFNAQYLD